MASGIVVSDECKTVYEDLKIGHKYRTMICRINDGQTAIEVVEKIESQEYDELVQLLTTTYAAVPAYVVFDFHHHTSDCRKIEKLLFINWCPDDAPIKKKMIQSSSINPLRKIFEGAKEIQATDKDELNVDEMIKKAK